MKKILSVTNKDLRKRNLGTVCSEVVLLLLSAFLLSLAHPSFISNNGFGFLAFFALIPVFAVIRNTSYPLVAPYGFLYGFVYYAIFNYWLTSFHPYAILIVTLIKAVEMIFLFLALKAVDSWFSKTASDVASVSNGISVSNGVSGAKGAQALKRTLFHLIPVFQAIIWVAYSYVSQSWFAGYPYGTIAYALYRYKILIQIADLFGIWGLNFMLVLPQAFLGAWCCDFFSKTKIERPLGSLHLQNAQEVDKKTGFQGHLPWQSLKVYLLKNKILVIVYLVLFAFQLVYGAAVLNFWKNAQEDNSFDVATVQHNADSWKGGYDTYKRNFLNLSRMSLEASLQNPDMIIWSETAFVPSVDWYTQYPYEGDDEGSAFDYLRAIQELVDEFVDFGTSLGIPLLTGNPSGEIKDESLPPYDEEGNWNKEDYNSVILFDDGVIKQSYRKQHLVPFTEHFPYEKQMPWLYNLLKANDYHWWEKGEESVVFETSNGIKFSTPICFEDVFGDICANFVTSGADLIVNMTNDSWSGSVAAERQHMAMAVLRSVENRRTTIRGTNSGITCLITPDGTIQGEMEPFKMGWKIWEVPVYGADTYGYTLYSKTVDIFAQICTYASYVILAFGAVLMVYGHFAKKSKPCAKGDKLEDK